jgi:hypothetical protein
MPANRIQQHIQILYQTVAGKSTNWTAKNLQHTSKLTREVQVSFNTPASIFQLQHAIAPKKAAHAVVDCVERLRQSNPSMSSVAILSVIRTLFVNPSTSLSTVPNKQHQHYYRRPPPVAMFPFTDEQIADRLLFACSHLISSTDWSRTIFADESSLTLGRHCWIWNGPLRSRGRRFASNASATPK